MKRFNFLMIIICLVRLPFNKSPNDSSKLSESQLNNTFTKTHIARSGDTTLLSVHGAYPKK